MDKFVFTPELTKEDAQRIIDALNYQNRHQTHESKVVQCAEVLRNKDLISRLRKLAKISRLSSEDTFEKG